MFDRVLNTPLRDVVVDVTCFLYNATNIHLGDKKTESNLVVGKYHTWSVKKLVIKYENLNTKKRFQPFRV